MRSMLAEVLGWLISWVPWAGLTGGIVFLWVGVQAMDEDEATGTNFFLISIAVTLLTGLFVALVMLE